MVRYFFNIYNGDTTFDEEGDLFADEHAAREYAVQAVRDIAAESVRRGRFTRSHRVEFLDAAQIVIGKVRFDEAVLIID